MKVLFDCIVTQVPASKCSTVAQFVTLAEELLQYEGVFIYWPVADFLEGSLEDQGYPQDERIKYFRTPQSKDRTREYNLIRPWLEEALSFTGPFWDWDVLVTVRTPQVPMMKVMATSPRQVNRRDWSKKIVVIEDMMVMSCKPTVAQSNEPIQDRMTIEGYLAADAVLIPAYHQKKWVMQIAKNYFSPAMQKVLNDRLKEVCHLTLKQMALKKEHRYDGKRKMNVAFVGRLERSNARLEVINGVLTKQFIMKGSKVNPIICTVSPDGSPGERKVDTSVIDVRHPDREEFHRMAREELDVGVFFHVDVELNMSMLEPISFGMPEIVKRAPWSEAMFGPDYPFFVDTEVQAYAMVNMFAEDYDGMYAKFEKWHSEWFVPTYTHRIEEEGLYSCLVEEIVTLPPEDVKEGLKGMKSNVVIKSLLKVGGDEFKIMDAIAQGGKKEFNTLVEKIGEKFDDRGLVWSTPWNDYRLALKMFYGYEDASVELGHLRKMKE